jgi:flagellar biogenesis protein FliO
MEAIQQTLVVVFVLGLLGATLYWLRSKGLAQFNGKGLGRAGGRRMRSIERLALTPQHSLHLVDVGGRVLLIAASPGGCSLLDGDRRGGPMEIPMEDRLVAR